MVSPHRTFCLALTSSVFMETTGSNLSGTRSTRGAFFTFFGKIYTPHLNLLPIFCTFVFEGTLSVAWWRFPRTPTALQRSRPPRRNWRIRKRSLKFSRYCRKQMKKMLSNMLGFFHVLFNNDSLFSVWILWDKKEIRRCQGETWEWCERYHRTDSG